MVIRRKWTKITQCGLNITLGQIRLLMTGFQPQLQLPIKVARRVSNLALFLKNYSCVLVIKIWQIQKFR